MNDPTIAPGVLDIGQPPEEKIPEESAPPPNAESFQEKAKRIGEMKGLYDKEGRRIDCEAENYPPMPVPKNFLKNMQRALTVDDIEYAKRLMDQKFRIDGFSAHLALSSWATKEPLNEYRLALRNNGCMVLQRLYRVTTSDRSVPEWEDVPLVKLDDSAPASE